MWSRCLHFYACASLPLSFTAFNKRINKLFREDRPVLARLDLSFRVDD
jgi:hypothetical protein